MGLFNRSSNSGYNTPEALKRPEGGDIETYRKAKAKAAERDAQSRSNQISAQRQARDGSDALKAKNGTDAANGKRP